MIFAQEKYIDIIEELKNLYLVMEDEVVDCPYKADVNHDQIINMQEAGLLQVITARKDGDLVGFHITMITNDIFYKDKKTAYVLYYFLLKQHRGGGKGLKMFEYAENLFKENEVSRTFMSRKIHINNEKLFISLGYNHTEANYEKYYE